MKTNHMVDVTVRLKRRAGKKTPKDFFELPKVFSHFVLNLPASAIDFLSSFRGIYFGCEDIFEPHTSTKMPLIHVYCFESVSDGEDAASQEICRRISAQLSHEIRVGEHDAKDRVTIHSVRDVAPTKNMFCATFRLPREVAFSST